LTASRNAVTHALLYLRLVVSGPDGNLWFTDGRIAAVGRVVVTEMAATATATAPAPVVVPVPAAASTRPTVTAEGQRQVRRTNQGEEAQARLQTHRDRGAMAFKGHSGTSKVAFQRRISRSKTLASALGLVHKSREGLRDVGGSQRPEP
jgi:hypothetical protein